MPALFFLFFAACPQKHMWNFCTLAAFTLCRYFFWRLLGRTFVRIAGAASDAAASFVWLLLSGRLLCLWIWIMEIAQQRLAKRMTRTKKNNNNQQTTNSRTGCRTQLQLWELVVRFSHTQRDFSSTFFCYFWVRFLRRSLVQWPNFGWAAVSWHSIQSEWNYWNRFQIYSKSA